MSLKRPEQFPGSRVPIPQQSIRTGRRQPPAIARPDDTVNPAGMGQVQQPLAFGLSRMDLHRAQLCARIARLRSGDGDPLAVGRKRRRKSRSCVCLDPIDLGRIRNGIDANDAVATGSVHEVAAR